MSAGLFLLLSLAGGLGAVCRFVLDGVVRSRWASLLPWGTIAINISGSLLLGLLTGLAVPDDLRLIVGTGFLGGYTTFSTASLETVRLLIDRRPAAALLNGLGVLVAATLAAGLGLWLGSLA